jgi:hypothetical protein
MVPANEQAIEANSAALIVHNAFRSPDLPEPDATTNEFVAFAINETSHGYVGDKTQHVGALVASLVLDKAGICDQRPPLNDKVKSHTGERI